LTWLYIAMADPESLARSWRKLPEQIAALRSSWRSAPTQAEIGASLSPASDTTPRLVVLAEFVHLAEPEVREATSRALHRLGGAVAQEVTIPDALARVQQSHRCIMARDAAAYHRQTYKAFRDSYGPKIAALIEEGLAATKEEYAAALDHLNAFRRRMESVFSQGTLAVLPATNTTAPNRLDTTGDPIFNSIWSFAGFPAVTVPCGLAADGMPCGLQLVGPPNSDLRLLAAAMWCEREIGFDDTPPMLGEPEIQARRRG
jgi:Asp-tRNA(Asn)/Glu-tRNA(Gln) amidotransferase A subunit family amidase